MELTSHIIILILNFRISTCLEWSFRSCHIPILILNFRISSWLEWSFPAIFILYLLEFLPGWDGLKTGAELTCHISLSFSIFVLVSITLERYQVLCTVESLGIIL